LSTFFSPPPLWTGGRTSKAFLTNSRDRCFFFPIFPSWGLRLDFFKFSFIITSFFLIRPDPGAIPPPFFLPPFGDTDSLFFPPLFQERWRFFQGWERLGVFPPFSLGFVAWMRLSPPPPSFFPPLAGVYLRSGSCFLRKFCFFLGKKRKRLRSLPFFPWQKNLTSLVSWTFSPKVGPSEKMKESPSLFSPDMNSLPLFFY